MKHSLTPSQTVGPYLHIGLDWLTITELAPAGVAGERVVLQGGVFDADRQPIPDGMVEIWQANAHGKYAHPDDQRPLPTDKDFLGFGRVATDEQGRFRFATIKPGQVPDALGKPQAPHILVNVFARGLLKQLVTRVYFAGDAHDQDPVLQQVPPERRATLIAGEVTPGVFEWNILIGGGDDETVFFEL